MYAKGTKVNSPTLLKLTAIKRDLSQCLQEEKRQSKPTKGSATTQFASSRNSSEGHAATFVPFEAIYVAIEDLEGIHCPIFKEYQLQLARDDASSAHFKVPRLPYPVFYWESPIGQCPFIPPLLANDSNHQANRKSSQPPNLAATQTSRKQTNIQQDLRSRAVINSSVCKARLNPNTAAPKIVFEPAMTDTSILTAKINLKRHPHNPHNFQHQHKNTNHYISGQFQANSFKQPILKITPNFSVNVNKAATTTTTTATTPKQPVSNLRKQPSPVEERKREKSAAVHRARPGFCECCCEKYSELEKHVKEPMHRQFAVQSDNYEGIDAFLGTLKRTLKADYLLAPSYNSMAPLLESENSLTNISISIQNNSPLSPTTTTSHHFITNNTMTARNYTGTKKLKQSIASKRIKMIANTTTSSILDEDEAEASGVITALSVPGPNAEANYISSPSCKRRKSFKIVQ
jgi:hypothetical protein